MEPPFFFYRSHLSFFIGATILYKQATGLRNDGEKKKPSTDGDGDGDDNGDDDGDNEVGEGDNDVDNVDDVDDGEDGANDIDEGANVQVPRW